MGKRMTVTEAATVTGLSEYAIRKGIRERRYPHIRTGIGSGRIIIDIALLEAALEREALASTEPTPASNILQYGQMRRISERG